ncbi:hypothetical protein IQ249_03685 [Lusitaniella coriacea LEGE 07157]|uniref:Uncharacterized protein n=1 Tax=Lusitaniella coriacea LEGE 07157 TaxID=945747 RepID=A0A8J7B710_9CYAN|nr:element excision factor XisH family protein [Lusitaniella coriacea]MBE9114994.1 hypothetical protein [Lusitaniella coriacea LEGE 07157]
MPVLDLYHNTVENAQLKDGWTITSDPLHLTYPDYQLHLAVREITYKSLFGESIGQLMIE